MNVEICCDPGKLLRLPGYRERYNAYEPPDALSDVLRAIELPMTVVVVFGGWCHDSVRVVPAVIKALAVAGNDRLRLLGVHVSYEETDPSPFMAGPIAVRRYPTVTFVDGHHEHTQQIPEGTQRVTFTEEPLDAQRIAQALS